MVVISNSSVYSSLWNAYCIDRGICDCSIYLRYILGQMEVFQGIKRNLNIDDKIIQFDYGK